jgi:hypothetical protein
MNKIVITGFLLLPLLAACGVTPPQDKTQQPSAGSGSVVQKVDYQDVVKEAQAKKDPTLCNQLSSTQEKADCTRQITVSIAIEKKDETLCATLPKQDQQNCAFSVLVNKGIEAKNVDPCAKLEDSTMQTNCKDQVWTNLAYSTNDVKQCAHIVSKQLQTACTETVTAQGFMNTGAVDKCSTITSENVKMDCYNNGYYTKAMKEKDKSLCAKITFVPQKEACLKALEQ